MLNSKSQAGTEAQQSTKFPDVIHQAAIMPNPMLGDVKCDMCNNKIIGKYFPVTNENFIVQKGLKQCESCYADNIA